MSLSLLLFAAAALLGLLFGSFLNVCTVRLPAGKSVAKPRSRCMSCGHRVRWFDNIPLLSFMLLRGRCRDCRAAIGWRYPLVECATALWFSLCMISPVHLIASPSIETDSLLLAFVHAAGLALLGFLLIGLAVMDWRTGLLPNEFTIGGLFAGLFFAATESFFLPPVRYKTFFTPEEVFIFNRVGAVIVAFLLLWAVNAMYAGIRKRPGIGRGDMKMFAMIGAFLGYGGAALALLLGVSLAAVVGIILVLQRQADGSTRLPFGSYLAAGGLMSALAGPRILGWYTSLFR